MISWLSSPDLRIEILSRDDTLDYTQENTLRRKPVWWRRNREFQKRKIQTSAFHCKHHSKKRSGKATRTLTDRVALELPQNVIFAASCKIRASKVVLGVRNPLAGVNVFVAALKLYCPVKSEL